MRHAWLLAMAVVACGSGARPLEPRSERRDASPVAPPIDPVLVALARMVGPDLRGVMTTGPAYWAMARRPAAGLDPTQPSAPRRFDVCHIKITNLRGALGAPLRLAVQIDGDVNTVGLDCLFGGQLGALLAKFDLQIENRPGGVLLTRDTLSSTIEPTLARACPSAACAVLDLGPPDHRVRASVDWGAQTVVRVTGLDTARLAAAMNTPASAALALRAEGDVLVATLQAGNDADLTSALAAAFLARIEVFRVPTSAMEPTVQAGEGVLALKGELFGAPALGDIVVHHTKGKTYLHRLIARGGQTVTESAAGIAVDGVLLKTEIVEPTHHVADVSKDQAGVITRSDLTGALVREWNGTHSYLTFRTGPPSGPRSWTVPEGELFLVSDNRNNANDSRLSGTIPVGDVFARVAFRWPPLLPDGAPDWNRLLAPID